LNRQLKHESSPSDAGPIDENISTRRGGLKTSDRGGRTSSERSGAVSITGAESRGPLEGLRAVVFTQAWAGTFATQMLSLMGAEVIQIEVRSRPDNWRGGYSAVVPPALRSIPTAMHGWNCNPNYNSVNLSKEAITLDVASPQGARMIRQLIVTADIVAENFAPRVMGNLGLDYSSLVEIRPDIIMLSLSAYGATGPYSNFPGIGGTVEPMAGMSALMGYEDGPPINSGNMVPDAVAGSYGAAALLIALHYRERTGRGQYIDLSMQEANMCFIADALMDYSANGRVRGRMGNHHPTIAPHNLYPCTGSDRWIALAASTDAEFSRLCTAAGRPDWLLDKRFIGAADRKRNETALDEQIGAWTSTRDAFELEAVLHEAGITAGAVRNADDVLVFEQLRVRGMLQPIEHPEAGIHDQVTVPWRLSRTPGTRVRYSPLFGEHSRDVFRRLLATTDEEYDQLDALGITGSTEPV